MSPQVYSRDVALSGTIIAIDIDRRGKAVEIALETEDFQQYVIESNGKGNELFDFIFDDVTITGTVMGKTAEGVALIRVKTYEIRNENVKNTPV
jgi:hypothetical protein